MAGANRRRLARLEAARSGGAQTDRPRREAEALLAAAEAAEDDAEAARLFLRLTELEHGLPPVGRGDTSRPGDPDPGDMTDEEIEAYLARPRTTRRGRLAGRAIPAMTDEQLTRLLHLCGAGSVAGGPR